MRKFSVLFFLMVLFAFSAQAQNASLEKEVDKADYVVAAKADAVSGSLDASDPVFGRRYGSVYSNSCDAIANASGSNSVYYDVYPFYTTTGENLDISSVSTGGTNDCLFHVYCDPFDPANADLNVTAIDDDDGPSLMPAFLPGDNYYVEANTQYYLVMTTFSNGATGTYDITFGGDFVIGVYAPPLVPLSNWAFLLIGLFVITFVFIKFKK